jgi:hypothetical protein
MKEKSVRQQVAVYAWSLAGQILEGKPRLVVPWSAISEMTGGKGFNGSAVALVPGGGSLLMAAGPQRLFAEVRLDGSPVRGGVLDQGTLPQPEALAFLPDGTLLMASEGGKGDAVLASYAPRQGGGSE